MWIPAHLGPDCWVHPEVYLGLRLWPLRQGWGSPALIFGEEVVIAEIWWPGHVAPPQGAGGGPWVELGVGSLPSAPYLP